MTPCFSTRSKRRLSQNRHARTTEFCMLGNIRICCGAGSRYNLRGNRSGWLVQNNLLGFHVARRGLTYVMITFTCSRTRFFFCQTPADTRRTPHSTQQPISISRAFRLRFATSASRPSQMAPHQSVKEQAATIMMIMFIIFGIFGIGPGPFLSASINFELPITAAVLDPVVVSSSSVCCCVRL